MLEVTGKRNEKRAQTSMAIAKIQEKHEYRDYVHQSVDSNIMNITPRVDALAKSSSSLTKSSRRSATLRRSQMNMYDKYK